MTVAASTKKFGINGNREGSLQQAGLGSVGFRKEDRKGGVLGEQMETGSREECTIFSSPVLMCFPGNP